MFAPHDRLCRNDEEIIAKVMDGEAIIINLASGMYYSMGAVGGVIWTMIEAQHTLAEIIDALTAMYGIPRARAEADVMRLGDELTRERIVTISRAPAAARDVEMAPPHPTGPYEVPVLNIYRDMGDLLALDPPMPPLKDVPWKEPGQ